MQFTRDEIRQMGHDPDGSSDGEASEETSFRFAASGRPTPKANGIKAHHHPSAGYEDRVGQIARQAIPHGWPLDRRYEVTIHVIYNDRRVGDVTNVQKSVEDALTGIVWGDDDQVDRIQTVREIDDSQPRCAVGVEVEQIEPPAVPDWVRMECRVEE